MIGGSTMSKNNKPKISKKNFITFLASASPKEINDLIVNKGKRPKPYCPIIIFDKPEDKKEN